MADCTSGGMVLGGKTWIPVPALPLYHLGPITSFSGSVLAVVSKLDGLQFLLSPIIPASSFFLVLIPKVSFRHLLLFYSCAMNY